MYSNSNIDNLHQSKIIEKIENSQGDQNGLEEMFFGGKPRKFKGQKPNLHSILTFSEVPTD